MRILVIGAKGMLGQAMVAAWFDHDVLSLDLPEFDITNPQQVRHTMADIRPQVVINCAAYTNVDQCETEFDQADRVNGTGVGYLAQACTDQKAIFAHISTDYVFDGNKADGYAEDDAPNEPVNAYGRTKLHGEEQVRLHGDRYYLVRTSWLYGPGGKNFVTTMLKLGQAPTPQSHRDSPSQAGGQIKVVNDQHGQPTYTRDLAGFVKNLVLEKAPYGIYHGVNEGPTTWYDFTREIFRQAGIATPVRPVTSAEFPRPAKRPTWSVLLNTKSTPLRSWVDALRDYLSQLAVGG